MKTRTLTLCTAIILLATMLVGCGSYNYDLNEYVTLGKYEGVEVMTEIIETELQSTVDSFLSSNSTTNEITDRAAKNGDSINIDYAGTVDGVAFDGGTATAQTLTLGEGGYIDGFEDGIVGMSTGETKDIDVTFPEDYGNEELNGKDAVFTITLNSISETIIPELTDALIAEKTEYSDIASYKAAKREIIKQNLAWEQVSAASTVKTYPEKEVKKYYDSMMKSYNTYAAMYGVTLEGYVSAMTGVTDMTEFTNQIINTAKSYVKNDMLAIMICEAKGIEMTKDEYNRLAEQFAKENGFEDVKALEASAGKSNIEDNVRLQLAIEWVGNNAVETTVAE